MSRRFLYIDLLRAFACLAVIIIHVSASNQYSIDVRGTAWQIFNVYDSLARFSVPAFVMISGVLFLDTSKPLEVKQIYKKHIPRILSAWIFWEVFYASVQLFKTGQVFNWDGCVMIIKTAITGHYHLWYLPMLIGLYMATPILRAITEKKDKKICKYFIYLFFAFSVWKPAILLFSPPNWFVDIVNKIPFTIASGYVGYFMLGYYLATYPMSKLWKNTFYVLGIAGAAATVFVSELDSISKGVTSGIVYDFFSVPVIFMSIGVFLIFKEWVSRHDFNRKFIKVVKSLSSCSFGIFLVHAFIIERIYDLGLTTLTFNPAFSVPIISFLGFFLSWFFVFLIKKIHFVKKHII